MLLGDHRGLRGPPATLSDEVPTIRRARSEEADAIAEVYLSSFKTAMPAVRLAHSDAEVRAWFASVVTPEQETWVAEKGGAVIGLLVLTDGWVDQLYVAPGLQRAGLGSRFIALAKERQPTGLELWAFQVNRPARAFYEKHGFREVESTDGSGNEEREPDVRYAWRP